MPVCIVDHGFMVHAFIMHKCGRGPFIWLTRPILNQKS